MNEKKCHSCGAETNTGNFMMKTVYIFVCYDCHKFVCGDCVQKEIDTKDVVCINCDDNYWEPCDKIHGN